MNKLILVLFLAVCLITVHGAVVKRETETSSVPSFDISKQLGNIQKTLEETFNSEKLKETFSPEKIQAALNKAGETIKEGLNKLIPTEAPKAA